MHKTYVILHSVVSFIFLIIFSVAFKYILYQSVSLVLVSLLAAREEIFPHNSGKLYSFSLVRSATPQALAYIETDEMAS